MDRTVCNIKVQIAMAISYSVLRFISISILVYDNIIITISEKTEMNRIIRPIYIGKSYKFMFTFRDALILIYSLSYIYIADANRTAKTNNFCICIFRLFYNMYASLILWYIMMNDDWVSASYIYVHVRMCIYIRCA